MTKLTIESSNILLPFFHDYLESKWNEYGQCNSCGWHAALCEYNIPEDVTIDMQKREIRFPCLSHNEDGSGHRGVTIYF